MHERCNSVGVPSVDIGAGVQHRLGSFQIASLHCRNERHIPPPLLLIGSKPPDGRRKDDQGDDNDDEESVLSRR